MVHICSAFDYTLCVRIQNMEQQSLDNTSVPTSTSWRGFFSNTERFFVRKEWVALCADNMTDHLCCINKLVMQGCLKNDKCTVKNIGNKDKKKSIWINQNNLSKIWITRFLSPLNEFLLCDYIKSFKHSQEFQQKPHRQSTWEQTKPRHSVCCDSYWHVCLLSIICQNVSTLNFSCCAACTNAAWTTPRGPVRAGGIYCDGLPSFVCTLCGTHS